MGLSVSAVAFVKVVKHLFQNKQKFSYLWFYVYDLCISSKNFADHEAHLNTVFNTLRKNLFTFNFSKARVGYDKLKFLWHTISANSVRIFDSKTKAIQKTVAPKSQKSLKRILGLLNYFQRHIANYNARTFHTRQLLILNTKFEGSDECEKELDDLKSALTNAPILAFFLSDKKVYMYTDAEKTGLKNVCLQFDGQGKPQVCAYISLATSKA